MVEAERHLAERDSLKKEMQMLCEEIDDLKKVIEEKDKIINEQNETMAYLNGQIEAFRFCLSKTS